ncbi:CopD family protein [Enterobacter sp. Bisph1]|uniref:CopD family protein n=1 Tax=Enterobacter sp. Bisph1 TaxID=1274399 RepID=UPI00057BCFD9|nr:CopD family protein [Enterobacter sp. Bisph1]
MNFHPWLNALHIAAAIVWIGGMLVMAVVAGWCAVQTDKSVSNRLAGDVRGWSRKFTTPAMLLLWIAGAVMVIAHGQMPHLWLILKIVVVLLLSGLHGFLSATLRRIAAGEAIKGSGAIGNAVVITIIAVLLIILLAVMRPF